MRERLYRFCQYKFSLVIWNSFPHGGLHCARLERRNSIIADHEDILFSHRHSLNMKETTSLAAFTRRGLRTVRLPKPNTQAQPLGYKRKYGGYRLILARGTHSLYSLPIHTGSNCELRVRIAKPLYICPNALCFSVRSGRLIGLVGRRVPSNTIGQPLT